ncbi:DUF1003 domain-containing protein [Oryzobacter terrae]|uniref:DUF1003 domain-containing protein n=1 Tax=Oryzobacter terrae TaxID=1620385 RepID=UPI00366FD0E2
MSEQPYPTTPLTSARVIPDANWHARSKASLSTGERAADLMRNGMGSWRFVFAFLAFMGVWAVLNSVTRGWDPYPFILLNLFLSMLAGLQGAILLIAAKRQDAIAADLAQHDYDTNVAAKHDVEVLLEATAEQLRLLRQLHDDLAGRLDRLDRGPAAPAAPAG